MNIIKIHLPIIYRFIQQGMNIYVYLLHEISICIVLLFQSIKKEMRENEEFFPLDSIKWK